jgi:hypothetical protein
MDEDGFLTVLGRLDEFITMRSGEVISPLRVSCPQGLLKEWYNHVCFC